MAMNFAKVPWVFRCCCCCFYDITISMYVIDLYVNSSLKKGVIQCKLFASSPNVLFNYMYL